MDPDEKCQGFLFKLKENGKEWKKLYVVLNGSEIIYYDTPHGARADQRLKDGVKVVKTAYTYDEFDGPNAPTSTPSYLMIETTHAKKIYCAKSEEERTMWVSNIKRHGRLSLSKSGSSKDNAAAIKSAASSAASGFMSMFKKGHRASSADTSLSQEARREMSATRLSVGRNRAASMEQLTAAPAVPDAELDTRLREMLSSLGIRGAAAESVMAKPADAKREMLKGYSMQQQLSSIGDTPQPTAYVSVLSDDPTQEELSECAAWLATAPIATVDQFVKGGGPRALAATLTTLCRHESRSDADLSKVR